MKDDERYCHLKDLCPDFCKCEGYAYTCTQIIDPRHHVEVRYLDLHAVPLFSHSHLNHFYLMRFLQYLDISNTNVHQINLTNILNLKVLDISKNKLTLFPLQELSKSINLRKLNIAHNPGILSLMSPLQEYLCKAGKFLQELVISDTGSTYIPRKYFSNCEDKYVSNLRTLDISQSTDLEVDPKAFSGLVNLGRLTTSDKVLCCIYKVEFPESKADCFSPEDELSSCTDLLGNNFLRVFLWLLSLASLLGNGGVIVYRLFFERRKSTLGFHTFVLSLSMSDFCMGLYLLTVGSADLHYKGEFLWQRWQWKRNALCTFAGMLGLMSSEVSAFTICLIMVDRLLVVKFPLHKQLHFSWRSATVAVALSWLIGVMLAALPLTPLATKWKFYQQNGICLPLPITRQEYEGQHYAFSVFVALNFAIFLVIGLGQFVIYRTVKGSSKNISSATDSTKKEFIIARRLFVVVFSDFCCWFPVGVMGLMANSGQVAIPGEINVWTAVFILPLNSALNPFLYTFSKYRQKKEDLKEALRYKAFLKRYKIENYGANN